MSRVLLFPLLLSLVGCATTFKPKEPSGPSLTGSSPFTFTLTPEQCLTLGKERRTYRAVGEGLLYLAGAGAVVAGIALAFADEKAAPAIGTSVSLVAAGGAKFTGSQVGDLDEELAAGGCPR